MPKESEYDERFFGKHFQIRFEPNDMKYYLRDLGHGFGTFIKIIEEVKIKQNLLMNIGDNYIVFTLGLEEDLLLNENYHNPNSYDNVINIKIFSGNIKHGMLTFHPNRLPLKIGRSPDCEIFIDDNMLSRVHCTVTFDQEWKIQDGSVIQGEGIRKSTNGTWIYAYDEIEITDKMTFKANHNLFICSYINKGK